MHPNLEKWKHTKPPKFTVEDLRMEGKKKEEHVGRNRGVIFFKGPKFFLFPYRSCISLRPRLFELVNYECCYTNFLGFFKDTI